MNHIYRIIWNETLGAWVAVAENVKRKGKRSTSKLVAASLLTLSSQAVFAVTPKIDAEGNHGSLNGDFTVVIDMNKSLTTQPIGGSLEAADGKNGKRGIFVKPKAGQSGGTIETGGMQIYTPTNNQEKFQTGYNYDTNVLTIYYYESDPEDSTKVSKIYKYEFKIDATGDTPEEELDAFQQSSVKQMSVSRVEVSADGIPIGSASDQGKTTVEVTTKTIRVDGRDIVVQDEISSSAFGWTVSAAPGSQDGTGANGGVVVDPNTNITAPFLTKVNGNNKTISLDKSASDKSYNNNGNHENYDAVVYSVSKGGDGGKGGSGFIRDGAKGGNGGDATNAEVDVSDLTIKVQVGKDRGNPDKDKNGSIGVLALSQGGNGGKGGNSVDFNAGGGNGGVGGKGLDAKASIYNTSIEINDHYSSGIAAISISGNGGDGGGGTGFVSSGGKGESAGQAGKVEVYTDAKSKITMHGDFSNGVLAQSVGGAGGKSGGSVGLVTLGGQGGMGGNANLVTVNSSADITMNGKDSNAITAQSLGGGGGNGGFAAGLVALGAKGGAGGDADKVEVIASGTLITDGESSHAILAQSIGGGGGNAGLSLGLVSIGANGNSGGEGGDVKVTTLEKEESKSEIITNKDNSIGIYAQSIGGGGGNGGLTASLFASIGGDGGDGNNSGLVTVENNVNITTIGAKGSAGIVAQSIGGGGGNGSMAITAGSPVSIAVGGKGEGGGVGKNVRVTSAAGNKIQTDGQDSSAIVAQSIGGGGGNGGLAVAGSASLTSPVTVGVALGGKGGAGAASGEVLVNNESELVTLGDRSTGITAQSLGGGGGNGGIAVAASVGAGILTANISLGGDGAEGGKAEIVTVNNSGTIKTGGNSSTGILAQSIAGGGGNGGLAVSGSIGLSAINANIALGGKGGKGSTAKKSSVNNAGNIVTEGNNSSAIISQSIGGAGGNAGGAVAASLGSANAVNVGIGGKGGKGGEGGEVEVINNADFLVTFGDNSSAIIAQSIGGDGGNGGFAGVIDGFGGNSVNLAFGGNASAEHISAGEKANKVKVDSTGNIGTAGDNSSAILAQSIGGTGGNGGLAIAAKVGGNSQFGTANIALGGKGGKGGKGGEVEVIAKKTANTSTVSPGQKDLQEYDKTQETTSNEHPVEYWASDVEQLDPWTLKTFGSNSSAIVAQSMGGAGGNGGFAVSGTLLTGGGMSVGVALGGRAGKGAEAQAVTVDTDHNILTTGSLSSAIIAQSIGGDGGNGGFAVAGGLDVKAGSVNVALGGDGGEGGTAEAVTVTSEGSIVTLGDSSSGVIAQSLGGGGGNAGFTVGAGGSIFGSAAVSLGGTGGTGGTAGDATITLKRNDTENPSYIYTEGNNSTGVLAQSLGGTGGNGGFSVAAGINANIYGGLTANVALGGAGGKGGTAGNVKITSDQNIITKGDFSSALQAQSIGGDGGNGGFSLAASLAASAKLPSGAFSVALGGKGGKGGKAVSAEVTSTEAIYTEGAFSNGVVAQSLGGSGGTGGFAGALSGSISPKGAISASVAVGGSGGSGGKSGLVTVDVKNDIATEGVSSSGIVAQSIGGSGGSGGLAASGALTASATGPAIALGSSVGGSGGMGAQAQEVTVNNSGNIFTQGEFSYGILAQSINGNGGSGGLAANLSAALSKSTAVGASVTIGGNGGGVEYVDDQKVKVNGITVGEVQKDGTLIYDNQTRDIDGYRINTAGQRVSATGFTIASVVEARNFGAGFDAYGYRIDENGHHILDSNGERILAMGYKTNVNGHFYIETDSGQEYSKKYVDQYGYLRSENGLYLSSLTSDQVLNENGYVLTTGNSLYQVDELGRQLHKDGYYLGEDGTKLNEDGLKVEEKGGVYVVIVDDKEKYDSEVHKFAYAVKKQLGKLDNPILVLTKIEGMYSKDDQIAWNAFLNQIKTEKANLIKNNVIVNNIKGENDKNIIKVISTEGYGSDGILAQSIGGNGGVGGMSISGAVSGSTNGAAVNASVAVGGNGGDGGISGNVEVENKDYVIATSGDSASAIRAQSIGGGGGKGGLSVAAGVSGSGETAASLTASVGGGGGKGNTAGNVTVTSTNNPAEITLYTTGDGSHGIIAESIGGGGGEGGFSGSFAVSGSLNKSAPAVALSIGGNGGNGNTSGEVKVTSVDYIVTKGVGSSGIVAKSIAGGGGDGGFGLSVTASGNLSDEKKSLGASIGIGGFGGTGNASNSVYVESTGLIYTEGWFSNGVLAQSIGGGGGNGGMSVAVNASLAKNGMGLSASVGGWGGKGGKSSTVDVIRTGDIHTEGGRAAGILAQSIGGGGGNGGNTYSGAIYIKSAEDQNKSTNITASVGGFGGSGNTSDKVTIDNTGNIITTGMLSSAIQAQSIGGGGGNGGNSTNVTLALECGDLCNGEDDSNQSDDDKDKPKPKKDTNLSFSVGGWGGTGNDGGEVSVTSIGILATSGLGSHGIYAQSIGGGGGDGGSSVVESKAFNLSDVELKDNDLTFALGVGGYKGAAGNSDKVTVSHEGVIITDGKNAKGIFAQSIGGGGGNGGDSSGATVGVGGGALQEELAVGMSKLAEVFGQEWDTTDLKGSAGNAGSVEVKTKKTQLAGDIQNLIYTSGNRSDAIFAQSIGGGGGVGGTAIAKLAVGGDGGAGGDGGKVTVSNELQLITKGLYARGIYAQSIGGGGGAGGDVEKEATVGIGGSGKNAGDANLVNIDNDAEIITLGYGSQGILAQSIGGGGGEGGSVEQATVAIGGGTLTGVLEQINASNLLGGEVFKVPTGGDGKAVKLDNLSKGHIVTMGDKSSAILVQSIGGGGGVGGNASGTISIGGFGAAAGNGGLVTINNDGSLETYGKHSSALVAQSIGGGGGEGGSSNGGLDESSNTVKEALIAIGGNGANAGNASKVTVTNTAELIYTAEENSKGILAQSIGGGGGQGGSSHGIDITDTISGVTTTVKEKLGSLGLGSGVTSNILSAITSVNDVIDKIQGTISSPLQSYFNSMKDEIAGGNAENVFVNNTNAKGLIVTKGNGSDALVAQSIGGGGGTSGSASGILIAGAASGAEGLAGQVTVDNNGQLITLGDHAASIVAQSIGGGGGLTSGIEQVSLYTVLGAHDAKGTSSAVSVTNKGSLSTDGKLSQAIIAQSIAGGGGATGLSSQLVLGGLNNAGSDAEAVDVTNEGHIFTSQDGSSAIIAQSIGGGGGFAAGVIDGNVRAGMGQGNSASVTIINGLPGDEKLASTDTDSESEQTGAVIQTSGAYAHGIVAQSIANGGGYANNIDADGNVQGYETIANNDSIAGKSGEVIVQQYDIIKTLGKGSVGILAQSTGQTAGDIKVINSSDALILGGSEDGAAIRIIDGKENVVENAGTLTGLASDDVFGLYLVGEHNLLTKGYLNANAVISGAGADRIENTGFITGNIDLGAGVNALNNIEGGWLLSGRSLVVNGLARNTANWAVSGVNLVGQTDLIGDFNQSDSGTYFWDWNFKSAVTPPSVTTAASSDTNYDVLNVSGDVNLDGVLSINIIDPGYVKPGDFELTFVTGSQVDLANLKLDSVASAVTTYNRSVINGDKGVITANINFAQKGLSKNGLSLGEAINQIQLNEVATFRPVAAPLFYRPDLGHLQDTYNLLSGEGLVANQQLYFTQNVGVMSDISMQMDFWRSKSVHAQNNGFVTVSCSSEDELGSARSDVKNCLEDNKWSIWLAGHNGSQEQRGKTTLGMADVNSDTYRTLVGLDVAVTPNTLVGLTYSNGKTKYEVQDRLTHGLMSLEGVNLFAMHNFEKSYVKGVIGYDQITTDVDRFAFIDAALDPIIQVAGVQNSLSGEAKSDAYSLRLEAGRMYELDGVNVTPFIGAQYTQLDTKAFREKALEDEGLLALQYEKSSVYSAPLFIGAQIDKNFVFSEGVIQPYARVSFTHDLSTKREMDASFVSAQGYTFTTQGGEPQRNSFDMNLGFKMTSITNVSLFGQYYGKYSSSSSTDQGGTIGLELNW